MSYQVLARKYRPKNFKELVGQDHVATALISALEHGRLHHAYLFTGTRGVGKTTIARILSKCLNCETGITATPCGVCNTCQLIDQGRYVDLIEIDAASRTKVEDTRELLENVPYAPTQGRYKVYLVDEVHMLSTHSFNALLKTLEEPPAHVKFIFATTDPQKLPITIVSRCLQFTLRAQSKATLQTHLAHVLQLEDIRFEPEALWLLAENAHGSFRDALSLTDQAIAFGQGQITTPHVVQMLGLLNRQVVIDIVMAIHTQNRVQLAQLMRYFHEQAIDATLVLNQLVELFHQLAMAQVLPEALHDVSDDQKTHLQQLAAAISAEDLQLYYQIATQSRGQLKFANNAMQLLEMCLLRLLAFTPLYQGQMAQQNTAVMVAPSDASHYTTPNNNTHHVATSANTEQQGLPHENDNQHEEKEKLKEKKEEKEKKNSSTPPLTAAEQAYTPSGSSTQEYVTASPPSTIQHTPFAQVDTSPLNTITPSVNESAPHHIAAIPDDIAYDEESIERDTLTVDMFADNTHTPSQSDKEITTAVQAASPSTLQDMPITPPASSLAQNTNTPVPLQSLLVPPVQTLEGSWTPEKWDYWIYYAALATSTKNLAMHGLVSGDITSACTFLIDAKHHTLAEELFDTLAREYTAAFNQPLQLELTTDNAAILEINTRSPLLLQQMRGEAAHTHAVTQIRNTPLIKQLITEFEAQLTVELKS